MAASGETRVGGSDGPETPDALCKPTVGLLAPPSCYD